MAAAAVLLALVGGLLVLLAALLSALRGLLGERPDRAEVDR